MNSSGYHEVKSSRKRTTHNSIEKIHADDRLESARGPFDQSSRQRSQIQRRPLYHRDIRAIVPYSPDLAPSDFYLFGYVKRCLAGLSFEDADQLLAAVEGVLEGIEK
jgi:hypothetical protein